MQAIRLNCWRPLNSARENGGSNEFLVKYLGYGELQKPGLEDMCKFVQSTIKASRKSKQNSMSKGYFTLSSEECILESDGSQDIFVDDNSKLVFRTRRILFCAVYEIDPKIFFLTYQFGKTADVLQCHVMKCRSKKEAKCLAKQAGALFKDLAFSLNRRLKTNSTLTSQENVSSLHSRDYL